MGIAVIGAGASGIVAALQAAWNGAAVTLFEHNPDLGKKLLVTGSGRCNITNEGVAAEKYHCADPSWIKTLIESFAVSDLIAMLEAIGIPVSKTEDGWYYPLSNSAHSVVTAFASALHQADVSVSLSTHVNSIHPEGEGWLVGILRDEKQQEEIFDRVILSAGGKAYPTLGSRGELFPTLEELGHTVLTKGPALAPILVELGELKPLQGVRLNVGTSLWDGNRCLGSAMGNLIFTQWGLNGPAVMDISHHVSTHPNAHLELSLNLLAFFQEEFDRLLANQRHSPMPIAVFLSAFFPPKVVDVFLNINSLRSETSLNQLDEKTVNRLVDRLKNSRLPVQGLRGFEYCQISVGGVPVTEVDPKTLGSCKIKGLYLTGETLDVVGPCGGYNLQFAFSSGALAGRAAAKDGS